MRTRRLPSLMLTAAALASLGCAIERGTATPVAATRGAATPHHAPAPLGAYSRPTSTQVALAQRWFDRGLLWTYGFNHDEGARCFREAQAADPDFALAYWGEAYALGPNINAPFADASYAARAFVASREALQRRATASAVERALIEALAQRYADPAATPLEQQDRKALDAAYAEAMRGVWLAFPDDPDVGTLFADARMNQRPWDYWTSKPWEKHGEPKPGIREALEVLRAVIAQHPQHPGAHHMRIHVCEASPFLDEAVASADALVGLVPGSGHLVHMPSHAWIRVGRYRESIDANTAAVAVDREYFDAAGPQGGYEFYRAHNHHFRAWAATYAGNAAIALDAARGLVADLPEQLVVDWAPAADGFLPVELHVLVRFGRWDAILAYPAFRDIHPYSEALRRYARGVAHAAQGDVDAARAEQQAFEAAAAKVPEDAMIFYTPAHAALRVARHVLAGEIAYRAGDFASAWQELRDGVAAEDDLPYDEPSSWMMPVRHALGALSLEQGELEQAERAYREDLVRHPENGWALHGLAECLERKGATAEAVAVRARFAAAWTDADTPLEHGSCFCRGAVAAAEGACCEPAVERDR